MNSSRDKIKQYIMGQKEGQIKKDKQKNLIYQ